MIKTMTSGPIEDEFARMRQRMIKNDLMGRDITDPDVLRVMDEIPREQFVPPKLRYQAYADGPLSIGQGQTISQPYIVALTTQSLRLKPNIEVLEIGTGSGYQTAVLSRLTANVYTIERHAELSDSAKNTLNRLGFNNIEYLIGDGSGGWPRKRPFERIIVTATVPKIPEPLTEQLSEDGIMVIPVGTGGIQELLMCRKKAKKIQTINICDCRFVKLIGKYGFD
jgi:protein-L-isoaspartate(D-aspartate) O-methyltransferase